MSDEIERLLDAVSDAEGEGVVRRARAELAHKDATIKALSEALQSHGRTDDLGEWHAAFCLDMCTDDYCPVECQAEQAALRLAGVLK
jgi:hypothetical protein